MSEQKGLSNRVPFFKGRAKRVLGKNFRAFLWAAVIAAIIYLIVRNIGAFGNVLLVVLGFGAVVLVHEFGHFIVAKLSGIKVEAFSIGFPPTLAGILRTERGWRIRILPRFFGKEEECGDGGEAGLSFTVGKEAKAGETEYRVGLVPFGGYVKMLGQEDIGSVKGSDDPRSFANKPVTSRMAVIAAGVFFNVISAVVVFMIVFLIGINLMPAVVGGVVPDSPAARAGLRSGDEVIEIGGKRDNLDFSNIIIAAALSDKDEEVALKVRHEDGSIEDFAIASEWMPWAKMRIFGVERPRSLTIAEVSDANVLLEGTGLLGGDRIKAVKVEGAKSRDVQTYWELEEIVRNAFVPMVTVLAERVDESGESELVESELGLDLSPASKEVEDESDLNHICSMVPRLRITVVSGEPASTRDKRLSIGMKKGDVDAGPKLQSGDIILAAADIENPTYKELRDVTEEYEKKELPVKVLRVDANGVEETLEVVVVPKRSRDSERVMIGIGVALDAEHPVVAKTISAEDGPARLAIPRGAVITAVDGVRVSSFYDCLREIKRNFGRRIMIDYRLDGEITGGVALDLSGSKEFITVEAGFADFVPFEDLKRLYKASGPIDAIVMGYKKTIMFIAQTYVTLKHLIGGLVSVKELMGPVGIVTFSYRIVAEQPLVYYVYFLGLISACIAVFNFLPLPPLDGGLMALLLVEKVKGSALSERVQGIIAYAGWVIIGSFFLYVTFNDIVRSFFR